MRGFMIFLQEGVTPPLPNPPQEYLCEQLCRNLNFLILVLTLYEVIFFSKSAKIKILLYKRAIANNFY